MSATDDLRRLLDERGVEWWAEDDLEEPAYYFVTKWFANGCEQTYEEIPAIRSRLLNAYCVTPEQAIEATLGRGECEKLPSDGITRCFVRRYGYEREFGYWKCSACGCECFEGARYCMGCGRKVRA